MTAPRVHPVDHLSQLAGIKALQTANLRRLVAPAEAAREGFVTAEYTLDFLRTMHDVAPSIVATAVDDAGHEEVVGYALVADRTVGLDHPLLMDLIQQVDRHMWGGAPLSEQRYVLCGQLCVAKSHRGIGLVDRMYRCFRDEYASRWDMVITDVVSDNQRSLHAHRRVGFEVVSSLAHGGADWHVVLWDWRRPQAA
jgi:GNAT superfamily N-acetyltransferase